jgi:hypothetical protein
MANLTAVKDPKLSNDEPQEYPVAASTKLFGGSFVVINASGYAAKMTAAASLKFAGIALETADNSAGANGAIKVKVARKRGMVIECVSSGLAAANLGDTVYADDDNVVTLTATSRTAVGKIVEVISATLCRVSIEPLV